MQKHLYIQFLEDISVFFLHTTNLLYLKYLFPKTILLVYHIVRIEYLDGFFNICLNTINSEPLLIFLTSTILRNSNFITR